MTLIAVLVAVGLLVALIAGAKLQPFLAFLIASITAAFLLGLPLDKVMGSIEHGVGDMLGSIAGVIVLGAMFGKLIADSGAATRIARTMIGLFGEKRLALAMTSTGFLVGVPLYYNVGFVLLVPLIFSVVHQVKRPAVRTGMPLLAGLSIAHGFLPPHPSPSALVVQFGADLGTTLLYGLAVAIPTLLIAGPFFSMSLGRIVARPPEMFRPAALDEADLPGGFASIGIALLPVLLIALMTAIGYLPGLPAGAKPWLAFLGNPTLVLLVSLGIGMVALGTARGKSIAELTDSANVAIRDIAVMLLIIAGGGALKQVLVDGGAATELGQLFASLPLPPLVLGWLIATVTRIALGSATVAGLTAASIVAPLTVATGADPNLMVLAVGAGSLMCSHVNDSGFWLFKEYFGLSLADTFRSWSAMETIVGTVGLGFVLLLNALV